MNDCQNAEIRDQLPELLHDRLSAGARAAVLAHVDRCAECRDELELLRGIHRAIVMGTPRIDTARIVSMLPKPGASGVVPIRPSRSRWTDWRVAATITVLAVGGTSVALLTHAGGGVVRPDSLALVPPVVAPSTPPSENAAIPSAPSKSGVAPTTSVAESEPNITREVSASAGDPTSAELGTEGRLTGLTEQQLRALLNDIGQLKATPITDPEPVTIKVDMKSSGTQGTTEMM